MVDMVDEFADQAKLAIKRMGQLCTVNGVKVYAILENDYAEVLLGDRVVESNEPMLTLATSDMGTTTNGDTVTVDDVNYLVAEVMPDTGGVTILRLRETA